MRSTSGCSRAASLVLVERDAFARAGCIRQWPAEHLRFIDALRSSDELSGTVEAGEAVLIEIRLQGVALFAKPLGPEFDTCLAGVR